MKHEVLTLPPKVRIIKSIELDNSVSKEHLNEIKLIILDYWSRVKKGEVSADAQALVQLGAIRRINSKYKVPYAMEMIQELLEQNQSIVIFTEFIETTQLLYNQIVNEYGNICVLLTGDTKDRQSVVDRFQSGQAKVFIGTSKAGGVGITLTKASNLILVDRPWTPGDTEQAEDRCYRIGQTESVFCYWLQLGEVDQGIDDLLEGKQANISTVLNGKAASITASNLNDFARNVLEKYKTKSK
jgi:SNF2 family DNA or RNA helicase